MNRVNKVIRVTLAILLLLCAGEAKGQIVVPNDSLPPDLYDYLVNSSSKHFHDPSIPRFLIKDRSYNFILGIGGYVQALALYDMGGMEDIAFVTSAIPDGTISKENPFRNTDVMNFDLGMSRLYLKLIGVTPKGYISAYVETDFHNSENHLRLRQAYLQFMGLTVGQTWSTFRGAESPTTLDVQGPPSMSDRRMPLVAYTVKLSKKEDLKLTLALELPSSTTITVPDLNGGYVVKSVYQDVPDVPLSLHWNRDRLYLFAATNIRSMKYPVSGDEYRKAFSYAAHSSARWTFLKLSRSTHNFYLQGIYAYGMVDCIQDLDGLGMNIAVSPSLDALDINKGWGVSAAYQYQWGMNQVNAIYSRVQVNGDIISGEGGLYRCGQYFAVNYLRNILKHGIVGAEAICGQKGLQSGVVLNDLRFNILLRYDF